MWIGDQKGKRKLKYHVLIKSGDKINMNILRIYKDVSQKYKHIKGLEAVNSFIVWKSGLVKYEDIIYYYGLILLSLHKTYCRTQNQLLATIHRVVKQEFIKPNHGLWDPCLRIKKDLSRPYKRQTLRTPVFTVSMLKQYCSSSADILT